MYYFVQVPKQPGSVECGYYVMHFMHDICLEHIFDNSTTKICPKQNYSKEDIDILRNDLALFIVTYLRKQINK